MYIMNQTPTTAIHGMTLEEKFTWKKPNVLDFKMFSCLAYVHVHDEKKNKTRPKGGEMHFHRIFLVNHST
jgi:hypothetical protein